MNFNQWKGYAAKKEVGRVTYLCGDQTALIELVIDDIKEILQVPTTDFVAVDASQDDSMWESASQYPLDPNANRLVLVRNAECVRNWDILSDWLAQSRANPKNFLVFVSSQDDAPSIFAKGKRVSYESHIELIRSKGKLVRCSVPNDEDLVKWSQSYGLSKASAEFLVERTSGDTASMLDILRKVHVWNGSPSPKALSLLCDEQALDSFVDYLVLRDKSSAILSLSSMSEEERGRIITRLDKRLDMLMDIGTLVRRRMYAGDIAATTGIKVYLVKRFMPVVKDYDNNKIRYCRQLLTMIDGAVRDGVKTGAWETLVTLW